MSSTTPSPRRRYPASTGLRLTLWYSAFFVSGCVLVYGLAYYMLSSSLARRDREAVLAKYWDLAGEYQDFGLQGLERALGQEQRQRKSRPFFIQYAPQGLPPTRVLRGEWREFPLEGIEVAGDSREELWLKLRSRDHGVSLEVLSLRLTDGLLLQVGQDDAERREILARFRLIGLWSLAFVILLGVPGGYLLASRALRPVRDLIDTIKNIEAGAVGARVPSRSSGDEFDELGVLFNGMLTRVETLIAGMKGALDNVAHDLRTPLTRLRAGAESALASNADLAGAREALADCVEESDRVVGMIETLMDISEAETGLMKLHLEPLDLRELAEEAVELYRYAAEDKGVRVAARHAGPVTVRADRNRMRQALANLLDNAIKYTDAGGEVVIELAREGKSARVVVRDQGAGIPAEDIPKVWDRLYRGDASRSQRGLGLGLSLVKAVVTTHRGEVSVDSEPGKGSRFTFVLPAA